MSLMALKLIMDPEKIVNQEFSIDFQGYNPEQVDTMLDNVIKDYQTYDKMISDLKEKIGDLERTNASLRAKVNASQLGVDNIGNTDFTFKLVL